MLSHGPYARLRSTSFDTRAISWDAAQSKTGFTLSNAPSALNGSRTFSYDSAGRMTASNFAGYTLDGVHNRTAVTGSVYAGSQIGTYTQDSSNPPGDHQTNQYTETPYDIPGYDENGNLVMLSPQGGVGVLLDFGVQQGSPAMEGAVGGR